MRDEANMAVSISFCYPDMDIDYLAHSEDLVKPLLDTSGEVESECTKSKQNPNSILQLYFTH